MQGSPLGISSCVYVKSGKYSPWNGSHFFWLLFWSIQSAWVPVFPGFICYALFGDSMNRTQKYITIGCGTTSFLTTFILGFAFGMALDSYYILAVSGQQKHATFVSFQIHCTSVSSNYIYILRYIHIRFDKL